MNNKKIIKKLKDDFLKTIHKSMDKKGASSLKSKITITSSANGVSVIAEKSAFFADKGRKAGKMPYSEDLKPWAKKRNIEDRALFPIARKIGRDGVEGKHFLDVVPKAIEVYMKGYSDTLFKELTNKIK